MVCLDTRRHTMVIVSDTRIAEQDMLEASIEIISVGNELLSGTIANTNAQWISAQITKAGGIVKRITTLGDWDKEISSAIKDSIQRGPDWLILTGGLGPTYDDNTLRGLSSALGQRLKLDPRAVEMLRRSYAQHKQRLAIKNSKINETRLKMAKIPRGSIAVQNPVGSAPSVYIDVESDTGTKRTRIFCLPGVPKEMKAIFSGVILPQIKEKVGKYYVVESMFETIGVSESMLAPTLSRLVDSHPSDELYLKTHPKGYSYVMKVSSNRRIRSKPRPKLNIQIVSKGKERSQVEARYRTILDTLKVEIRRLRGKMYSK
ncbi:MAG TPA: molybdopterin-binding protein [Nitrososphaeraceae archaeon]|nr:molybdopterin-binding protein [Nitrososphaeraceae archaeon]